MSELPPGLQYPEGYGEKDEEETLCPCCRREPIFSDKGYCAACWVEIEYPENPDL